MASIMTCEMNDIEFKQEFQYISFSKTPPPRCGCKVYCKEICPILVEKFLSMFPSSLVEKTLGMIPSSMTNTLRLDSDYFIKKLAILLSNLDKEIMISILKRLQEQIIQDPQFNKNEKDELLKMIEKAIKDLEGIRRHRCDNCGSVGCNGC